MTNEQLNALTSHIKALTSAVSGLSSSVFGIGLMIYMAIMMHGCMGMGHH